MPTQSRSEPRSHGWKSRHQPNCQAIGHRVEVSCHLIINTSFFHSTDRSCPKSFHSYLSWTLAWWRRVYHPHCRHEGFTESTGRLTQGHKVKECWRESQTLLNQFPFHHTDTTCSQVNDPPTRTLFIYTLLPSPNIHTAVLAFSCQHTWGRYLLISPAFLIQRPKARWFPDRTPTGFVGQWYQFLDGFVLELVCSGALTKGTLLSETGVCCFREPRLGDTITVCNGGKPFLRSFDQEELSCLLGRFAEAAGQAREALALFTAA